MRREDPGVDPLMKRLLLADAGFEVLVAILLSGLVGRAHFWLNVERPITLVGALVFALVGIALAAVALSGRASEQFVRILAFANAAGGAAIWLAAALEWSQFEPGGHWLVAFVANGCLVLAALEYLALRRSAS